MSEVNDVFRATEIEWDGRTWQFPRPNFGTEGAYAKWLRLQAVRDVDALAEEISVRAYKAMIEAIADRFAARAYDWRGDVWQLSLRSDTCFRHLCWLILTQVKDQQTLLPERMVAFYKDRGKELVDAWGAATAPTPPTPPAPVAAPGANPPSSAPASAESLSTSLVPSG